MQQEADPSDGTESGVVFDVNAPELQPLDLDHILKNASIAAPVCAITEVECEQESESGNDSGTPSDSSTSNRTESEEEEEPPHEPPSKRRKFSESESEADDEDLAERVAALKKERATLVVAKIELKQQVNFLEEKRARLMEENQSLREEAQVQERKVELLKKARRDFKNQNLDSVRSLQKAVVEPGTRRYAAAVYLDSKDNIEQQISKDGWRAVLLNDPDLPQKMKSGARSSDNLIAIADGELNECYEESKGSFISCLRHVAISIFRVERLLYFSYGGTKRTGRREATLSLPQPLKEAFFDIATQIARMERYTWFERSKGASSSVSDVKRSAKRALADLITERRPKSKTDKDGRSSTESIDSEDD